LVDAVALPDAHDRVGLNNRTEGDGEVKRGMERLRLMILAEGMRPLHYHEKTLSGRDSGPPEEIRKCYEGLRDKLEKGAEEGNEGIKGLLEECRKLVEGLPAGAVAIGQPEGV